MNYSLKIYNFFYCGSIKIGDQLEITFKYFAISKRSSVKQEYLALCDNISKMGCITALNMI